jgi:hypothetical protein
MARNYSGAPRFCPGYHLSMKVAKEVCAQFTKVQRIAAGPTNLFFWLVVWNIFIFHNIWDNPSN